jgi:hypothetical protein
VEGTGHSHPQDSHHDQGIAFPRQALAIYQADRALSLLGRKARLAEISYHALHAKELMGRFELSG